ncbi:hypothetical protein CDL15_Pgr019682 [Punica granatum]|uniref:Uncharacterized protein n=1 Tax=Punica granatum TaxID=22663 RepID=A0A218X7N9_PUNGR|nr:hypothetical protein CDL15_Pgr019682 [Punica granatum]PKI52875.1 hypothetical protein CRG98_026706 [Punica granatum]
MVKFVLHQIPRFFPVIIFGMRISDQLASHWKYVWAANVVLLKYLQLKEILQVPSMSSSLSLLILSASSTIVLISTALAIDIAFVIWVRSNDQSSGRQPNESCRGGICWHEISKSQVLSDEYTILVEADVPNSSLQVL